MSDVKIKLSGVVFTTSFSLSEIVNSALWIQHWGRCPLDLRRSQSHAVFSLRSNPPPRTQTPVVLIKRGIVQRAKNSSSFIELVD